MVATASLGEGFTTTLAEVAADPSVLQRVLKAQQQLERWEKERNARILAAHEAGWSYRRIGQPIGLSHPTVMTIVAEQKFLRGDASDQEMDMLARDPPNTDR